MSQIEGRGRNVEEAIVDALARSGLSRSDVEVNVISEGKSALLGLIGGEDAVVEIVPKSLTPGELDGIVDDVNDFVSNVISLSKLDLDVYTHEEDGAVRVDITGIDSAIVIGKFGDTLSALQLITKAATSRKHQEKFYLSIDVDGYLDRRDEKLKQMATRVASEALRNGSEIELEPMNARERRVVHMALSSIDGIQTESFGEGNDRRLVIKAVGGGSRLAGSRYNSSRSDS